MASKKLGWNAVLKFVTCICKLVHSDDIATKALAFFDMDPIMAAKELVWTLANLATLVTSRKKNPADNMIDIIKAIEQSEEKKISLPQYVIFEPDEVPGIAGEIQCYFK
ncbi:hypothetical protein QYM36_010999 [Artemia franciscana]|uniref:Uncharacterized protein n=1 Tax=Artemia franciscana TaxID=6661 RepID=A0AA88KYE2_ARTSF|nr:hypothetical protein QYM36_010999 [Artemia franciscana]